MCLGLTGLAWTLDHAYSKDKLLWKYSPDELNPYNIHTIKVSDKLVPTTGIVLKYTFSSVSSLRKFLQY